MQIKKLKELVAKYGLRNSQLLTIAPTGTLSTMLGISGGIEPIFANSYTRKTESLHGHDEYYKVYTPIVQKYMDENSITDEKDLPKYFVTSADIKPKNRIKMQASWQQFIDASISSTINLPESATVDDVKTIYMAAWDNRLKGVTIFRTGCGRQAVLSDGIEKEELNRGKIVECSDELIGLKRKLQTGCGSLHVEAFFDPNTKEMQEVFFSKGSTGGCQNFMVSLSRMVSLSLRGGISIYSIKDQLDSTGVCPSYATRSATKHDTSKGSCCPMAIGNALIEMYETMNGKKTVQVSKSSNAICPKCGAELVHEGGCDTCKSCGYSHCE